VGWSAGPGTLPFGGPAATYLAIHHIFQSQRLLQSHNPTNHRKMAIRHTLGKELVGMVLQWLPSKDLHAARQACRLFDAASSQLPPCCCVP